MANPAVKRLAEVAPRFGARIGSIGSSGGYGYVARLKLAARGGKDSAAADVDVFMLQAAGDAPLGRADVPEDMVYAGTGLGHHWLVPRQVDPAAGTTVLEGLRRELGLRGAPAGK